jgi:hypothetical protein
MTANPAALSNVGVFDLPAWWGMPGRPGMGSDLDPLSGAPWTFAGHVRGAWRLVEPTRAPSSLPFPGVHSATTPLVFYDTASVAVDDGALDGGLSGALMRATGGPVPPSSRRARSVIALQGGAEGLDQNALSFERGDSLAWARAEVSTGSRGGTGGWDTFRRHVWGTGLGFRRGAHAFEGSFAQRGGSARLTDLEQESASGESGAFGYHYSNAAWTAGLRLARGHDAHESYDPFLVYSRRDAQENDVRATATLVRGDDTWSGAAEWTEARISRSEDGAFEANASGLWSVASLTRPAGEGALTMRLAGGRRPGIDGAHLAPGLDYVIVSGNIRARAFAGREMESVWADLAPGQAAFLQSTWNGGLELAAEHTHRRRRLTGALGFRFGETRNRALVSRRPIEDLWLRSGFRADPGRYSFGLLTAHAAYAHGPLEADGEGFALLRDRSALQPQVDPGVGFRAGGATHFTAFTGDLDVRLRLMLDGVGPRESEAIPSRRLPGYVSLGAGANLRIADAVVTLDVLNLEDVRREQVWIDGVTGVEALGSGRTFRLLFVWRLFG